jgi:hypothetical protein
MERMSFSFSDTITGYVTDFNRSEKSFGIKTSDGREYQAYLTPTAWGRIAQNLEEPYKDCTERLAELLKPGQHVFAYGIFYPHGEAHKFEVKSFVFPGDAPDKYRHEEQDWWVKQVRSIADSYLYWQFNYPQDEIDYREYRTFLRVTGVKKREDDYLQETDTISRLVYGFASAYLMTGEDRFWRALKKVLSTYAIACGFMTQRKT